MTNFTFIHAADLHLGSPLQGLALKDPDIARRFASAGRRAFTRLVDLAIEMGAAFVIVAGDVYDGDWTDATIGLFFAREAARLDRAGIPLVMVRGNHDAESVITRSISLPASARTFASERAETLRLEPVRVALHGRSFPHRSVEENLALSYPEPESGWFNVGVLHTCCAGHPAHASYAPCSVADLSWRGYDYWALGHVHEHAVLSQDPWIVFPGNLQGRSVRECGEKGVVAVEVADGRVREVRRVILDEARFGELSVDLGGIEEEGAAYAAVEAALRPFGREAAERLFAIRVTLTGASGLHARFAADRAGIAAEVQAAAHRVHHDIWLEGLRLHTERPAAACRPDPVTGIDPAAMLAAIDRDPEFRAKADAALAEIAARIPAGVMESDLAGELDALCAEAEALVIGRLAAGQG